MTDAYKIPKRFYDDHVECCDLPAPAIIRETKSHYFIDAAETDEMAELRSNATYYADGLVDEPHLVKAAKALLNIIGEDTAQSKEAEATFIKYHA
jgi:hypothetical protein